MSISPNSESIDPPPDEDETAVDAEVEREPSPRIPSEPPNPPSSLPLHSIPRPSRRALNPTTSPSPPLTDDTALMPLAPSDSNVASTDDGEEGRVDDEAKGKGKAKEKEAEKWVENVDYAYEYVPVVQRRQDRKNM